MDIYLRDNTKKIGLSLTEQQLEMFRLYYENLTEWNKVMNLTAITEEKDVYEKHFMDSLMIFRILPPAQWETGLTLIDVGTGAGFPGLPIAICMPQIQVTLMDSLQKRVRFLEDTIGKLGLKNVTAVHARAEELARKDGYRDHYDLSVSRAVANLSTLSEYCLPFVKPGGQFCSYKTDSVSEELEKGRKAIRTLGGGEPKVDYYTLPGTDYHRSLVLVPKTGATPRKYPRKAGLPAKEPL